MNMLEYFSLVFREVFTKWSYFDTLFIDSYIHYMSLMVPVHYIALYIHVKPY